MKPTLDELLALDLLTLAEHTERAGDRFEAAGHAVRLRASLDAIDRWNPHKQTRSASLPRG